MEKETKREGADLELALEEMRKDKNKWRERRVFAQPQQQSLLHLPDCPTEWLKQYGV